VPSYEDGYRDGYDIGFKRGYESATGQPLLPLDPPMRPGPQRYPGVRGPGIRKKRKLSAWNKFVKANSKKPRFRYKNGKLNLKKMGVAFRKTPAGKKGRRR